MIGEKNSKNSQSSYRSGGGSLTIRLPTNRPRHNSTHTIRQPNKPSVVTTWPCDYDLYRYFHPPRLWGGRFVTCNMTSTLFIMLCGILSTFSWSKMWTICHMIFRHICDVRPAVKRNVEVLSHDVFRHICDAQLAVKQNVDISLLPAQRKLPQGHLMAHSWVELYRLKNSHILPRQLYV